MKKAVIIFILILAGAMMWYKDIFHEPVEPLKELIGHNYDYAYKKYFKTEPDVHYKININKIQNEFDGGILSKTGKLTDSIVSVYTWKFITHKKTIWVGKTKKLNHEIIDAIRYQNGVQF